MGKGRRLFDSNAQVITLLTLVIQFLHCLLCLANYLDWVRHQEEVLGLRIVRIYLAMTIIAIISYLTVSSVFYMWAWRYANSEDAAKRRRIWGIGINLLLADFPLFCTEVDIVWNVSFATGLQGLSFIFTCASFAHSAVRVWLYTMVRFIKRSQPPQALSANVKAGGGVLPPRPNNQYGQGPSYELAQGHYAGGSDVIENVSVPEEDGPAPIMAALENVDVHLDDTQSQRAGGIVPYAARQTEAAPTPAGGIIPASYMYNRGGYDNVAAP